MAETRHIAEVAALNEDNTFDTNYLAAIMEVDAGGEQAPGVTYYMCCHHCGACSAHSKDRRATISVAAAHVQDHKTKEASDGQEG